MRTSTAAATVGIATLVLTGGIAGVAAAHQGPDHPATTVQQVTTATSDAVARANTSARHPVMVVKPAKPATGTHQPCTPSAKQATKRVLQYQRSCTGQAQQKRSTTGTGTHQATVNHPRGDGDHAAGHDSGHGARHDAGHESGDQ